NPPEPLPRSRHRGVISSLQKSRTHLIPMARSFEMTIMPWSPLANGLLSGKYNIARPADGRLAPGSRSRNRPTKRGLAIAGIVASVAKEVGHSPAQVALAWLRSQPGSIIPIIGSRTVEQLDENLGCLSV